MHSTHSSTKIEEALFELGWHKCVNSNSPYQLRKDEITWHSGFRFLHRHRYLGVTADNAIRYRTSEGIRINFCRPSRKPSRLLITTLATSAWLRWLLHHGLIFRGYKQHQHQLGTNRLYHQDVLMAEQLLLNEELLIQIKVLASQPGLLRWELSLIPHELTINLTLANNYNLDHFSNLFTAVKLLTETINQIPHSKNLSLTATETNHASNAKNPLKKSQTIKGGLLVLGVLLLSTSLLMGMLFGISWLLT